MKKQNNNDKRKGVDLFHIRDFDSKFKINEGLWGIGLKDDWKTDPSRDPEEQGNKDRLVFTLDPNDRRNSSYKMIKKLPKNEKLVNEDGEEREEKHEVFGFVKAHHKENKRFKIRGKKSQQNKIKGVLLTGEEFKEKIQDVTQEILESDDQDNMYSVRHYNIVGVTLKKKPWNYSIVGYIEVDIERNQDNEDTHYYIAIVKPNWLFLLWFFLGLQILLLCLMMVMFPYEAPQHNTPGEVNGGSQSWDGTFQDNAEELTPEPGMLYLPGYMNVKLNKDITGVRMINPNLDQYLKYVIYEVDDPDTILYDSGYIDVMSEVIWEAYDQLDAGTYEIQIDTYAVDSTTWDAAQFTNQTLELEIIK